VDKNFDTTLSGALHAAADAASAADAPGARARGRQRAMRKRIVLSTASLALVAGGATTAFQLASSNAGGTPNMTATSPIVVTSPSSSASRPPAANSATASPSSGGSSASQSPGMSASSTPDTGVRACGNGDLLVWGGAGRLVAGHSGQFLMVTNESGRTCTVQGYLNVVVGNNTKVLARAIPVLNGFLGDGGPRLSNPPLVTLAPKASAKAMLETAQSGGGPCYYSGVGTLRVTAPGTTIPVSIGGPYTINLNACPNLSINPLVADPNAGPPAG
jgi:hypothetical protein